MSAATLSTDAAVLTTASTDYFATRQPATGPPRPAVATQTGGARFRQTCQQALIRMSTPAGMLSLLRASTVLVVGSEM